MFFRGLVATVLLMLAAPSSRAVAQPSTLSSQALLGAWRLVKVETIRADGSRYSRFGPVDGTIAYTPSGDVVVAWGKAGRSPYADPELPSAAEVQGAVEDFFNAYFGTFELDVARRQVRHTLRGQLAPGRTGQVLVRDVDYRGDTLVLIQPPWSCPRREIGRCTRGEMVRLELTWIRAKRPE